MIASRPCTTNRFHSIKCYAATLQLHFLMNLCFEQYSILSFGSLTRIRLGQTTTRRYSHSQSCPLFLTLPPLHYIVSATTFSPHRRPYASDAISAMTTLPLPGKEWPYSRPTTPLIHHAPQLGFIGLGSMGETGHSALRALFTYSASVNRVLYGKKPLREHRLPFNCA